MSDLPERAAEAAFQALSEEERENLSERLLWSEEVTNSEAAEDISTRYVRVIVESVVAALSRMDKP